MGKLATGIYFSVESFGTGCLGNGRFVNLLKKKKKKSETCNKTNQLQGKEEICRGITTARKKKKNK